jgi:hypothetical protein
MATDVNDDDNEGDNASSTGCDEGDNRNRNNDKRSLCINDGDNTTSREAAARQEAEAV